MVSTCHEKKGFLQKTEKCKLLLGLYEGCQILDEKQDGAIFLSSIIFLLFW